MCIFPCLECRNRQSLKPTRKRGELRDFKHKHKKKLFFIYPLHKRMKRIQYKLIRTITPRRITSDVPLLGRDCNRNAAIVKQATEITK
jgi:hypothetical protein